MVKSLHRLLGGAPVTRLDPTEVSVCLMLGVRQYGMRKKTTGKAMTSEGEGQQKSERQDLDLTLCIKYIRQTIRNQVIISTQNTRQGQEGNSLGLWYYIGSMNGQKFLYSRG